jgi:RNA methyltransferase, TrmH family
MAEHMKSLSSRQHPLVSVCRAVARGRVEGGSRMLLDGVHLVTDALAAGIELETTAFTARLLATEEGRRLAGVLEAAPHDVVEVSEPMMAAMSPVSSPSGVVAIAVRPDSSLRRALARAPQLVVVAVDVQEPGNVGAIVRAAEACGATGVVFCGASADPFGWKALRGSMGSTLRLPVAAGLPLDDTLAAARGRGVRVVATLPKGGQRPHELDLSSPTALVFGGEGPGLSGAVLAAADARVSIPMQAPVESLNVAVAAALLVYEAARQRGAI